MTHRNSATFDALADALDALAALADHTNQTDTER